MAQIVLLDNKFATLPFVVGEGRRVGVIGNGSTGVQLVSAL